ncbi:hypothetical protein JTE90_015764 [Oedothorax gibbosus]|uniref:Neurotransmitter-gated ion-channel transmembrane domain-containing protein n=1 Tax=Oedothorax gibbosus TaxID=931172 RepID=A0AAV6VYR1_9ARAC|nr:hypothetical protein JTE90_015764 [Oedothorax gibbosus]
MHRPDKLAAKLKPSCRSSAKSLSSSSPVAADLKERSSRSLLANVLDLDDDFRPPRAGSSYGNNCSRQSGYVQLLGQSVEGTPTTANPATAAPVTSCLSYQREISDILSEIKFITKRMRDDDATKEIISEWKYMGMVVDRMCFILFTAFTIISSCVCLLSAPHLTAY